MPRNVNMDMDIELLPARPGRRTTVAHASPSPSLPSLPSLPSSSSSPSPSPSPSLPSPSRRGRPSPARPGHRPAPPVIAAIVLAYAAAAVVVLGTRRVLRRWVFAVAIAPVVLSFVVVVWQIPSVVDGDVATVGWRWVPQLAMSMSFRLDGFAALMALLVTGIGVVVLVYARGYFAGDPSPGRVARFAGLFTLFAGAMLGLVVADDVWTLFVFWELTSVLSFLLIGLDDHLAERPCGRAAGAARDRRRRPGDARRTGLPRPRGRHRRPAAILLTAAPTIDHGAGRTGARAGRRVHQVGAVPVPLLAAGRDGGAHAGQRVPPLGDDGQGRRRASSPASPRRSPSSAGGARCCVVVGGITMLARRGRRAAARRRQAVAGVRHRVAARLPRRAVRRR